MNSGFLEDAAGRDVDAADEGVVEDHRRHVADERHDVDRQVVRDRLLDPRDVDRPGARKSSSHATQRQSGSSAKARSRHWDEGPVLVGLERVAVAVADPPDRPDGRLEDRGHLDRRRRDRAARGDRDPAECGTAPLGQGLQLGPRALLRRQGVAGLQRAVADLGQRRGAGLAEDVGDAVVLLGEVRDPLDHLPELVAGDDGRDQLRERPRQPADHPGDPPRPLRLPRGDLLDLAHS